MLNDKKNYWFLAKKYGWGWGLPVNWQGWIVFIVYLSLVILNIYVCLFRESVVLFISINLILTVLLIAVCWLKGESPSWKWEK